MVIHDQFTVPGEPRHLPGQTNCRQASRPGPYHR